ncbi:MAG: response regulator [Calditrichaceae bacterium]
MKVFICEQDQLRAKSMQDILGVYNYTVVTINKQTDLIKEVTSHRPAVIIMNECFAKNSGSDTLNSLRRDPVTAEIPVIFIGKDHRFLDDGDALTEFVEEPIKIKNLRHYIDRWTIFKSLYIKH